MIEPMEVVQLIVGSIIVIAAAYYTTYFIASRKSGRQSGRAIKMRDRFALSKDKTICVFEVRDTVYIVAMGANGATLLDRIPLEEFGEEEQAGIVNIQRGLGAGFERIKKSFSPSRDEDAPKVERRRKGRPWMDDKENAGSGAEAPESEAKPSARFLDLFADDDPGDGGELSGEVFESRVELEPSGGETGTKPAGRAPAIKQRKTAEKSESAPVLKMAQEEDELDIVFRKLMSRRTAAGSAGASAGTGEGRS